MSESPTTAGAECPPPGVDVRIGDLLVGSTLEFPIYDQRGVLLLAEGLTITSELKQRLTERRVDVVRLSESDAKRATLSLQDISGRDAFALGSVLSEKLDTVIDQGLLFVKNTGPAVRDQMVFHGRKAYNASKREELLLNHQSTSESLDSMMREAMHGRQMNGRQVTQLVATYLTDITEDCDNVVTAAMSATRQGLADIALQTSLLGMAIAVELKLDADNVRQVGIAGLVHNWGLAQVPEHILQKASRLTEIEMLEVKKHPIYTLNILERVSGIPGAVPLVAYQVHERPNGSGYPRGRNGNSIHLFARILHVAMAYTALTSPKPYRPPLMAYGAMECLLKEASQKSLDPVVVKALLNTMSLFPIGSFVVLSNGSIAQVLRSNREKFTVPIVQLIRDERGEKVPAGDESIVDLAASDLSINQAVPTPGRNEISCTPDIPRTVRPPGGSSTRPSTSARRAS